MSDKNKLTKAESFYRAFEDRHRGSRELIRKRLEQYLSFITPLNTIYPDGLAIDLGCGRGEWLEVAKNAGFRVCGVDKDQGMLEACAEHGHDPKQADALDYLLQQPSRSACIFSAFHMIEHAPFDVVQALVQEALRVLVPGGLLILETPNPENLMVATLNFYLDPSHLRPIPPLLLEFLVEFVGYARWKIVRLQENPDLRKAEQIGIMDILSGPSPDYAIVAQKKSQKKIMNRFNTAFGSCQGLTGIELYQRYDKQLAILIGNLVEKVNVLEKELAMLRVHAR
jgi:O-antigen chain-terminating methyltransferase